MLIAGVAGIVVASTSGDDDEQISTEESRPDDTDGPDETEPDATDPDETVTEPTETQAPDTDPTEPATTAVPTTTRPTLPPVTLPPMPSDPPETEPEDTEPFDTDPPVTEPAVTESGIIGEPVTVLAAETVLEVTVLGVVDPAEPREFGEPEEGFRLVAVSVRILNASDADYHDFFPMFGAALIDREGGRWDATFGGSAAGADLGTARIRPNDVRMGWMTFALPENVAASEFRWSPDSGFSSERLSVDLSESQEPPAAPAITAGDGPFGTEIAVESDDVEVTVNAVQFVDPAPPAEFNEPATGFHLVSIEVQITNDAQSELSLFASGSFSLIDSLGQDFPPSYKESEVGSPFSDESVQPGDTASGFVTFEVPDGTVIVKVQVALGDPGWVEYDVAPAG